MTDEFTHFHPSYQRARTLGNRSRHAPLIATPDERSLDWKPVLIVFGGGSAFFFTLGFAGWLAWVLLP